MFKKVIIAVTLTILSFLFTMTQFSQAQCVGVCAGAQNGNLDLVVTKTYTIEPSCSGSAKIVTFTLQYANIGTGIATGILVTDTINATGGLTIVMSGGNTMTFNLSGLAAGQTGKITYQALFYGSGYFSGITSISELVGNEPISKLTNNTNLLSGSINIPMLCPFGGLGGGATYVPVPLPSPYVAATVPVQVITYIPKLRVIGNNASIYYGFTKVINTQEKLNELAMIKENTKDGKLPFVGSQRTKIIGKAVLKYVPGMK